MNYFVIFLLLLSFAGCMANSSDNAFYKKDQHAIEVNSKSAMDYLNQGIAFGRKGQFDQAIAEFDKAIEINPKFAALYG